MHSRRSSASVVLGLCAALAPVLTQAQEKPWPPGELVITGSVVQPPTTQVQRVSGYCGSRPVSVDLIGLPIKEAVVRNGSAEHRYTTNTTFVRDVSNEVAHLSMRLKCPDFYPGVSLEIITLTASRCAYAVNSIYVQFDETAGLIGSWRKEALAPDNLRAGLRHERDWVVRREEKAAK